MQKGKTLIIFHSENISFILKGKKTLRNWINKTILKEKRKSGVINYVFCDDEYLHKLNKTYLKHDDYTDIITFDQTNDSYNLKSNHSMSVGTKSQISGDIFISIDRVKENSRKFNKTFANELHRVMIHAILHLLGYNDTKPSEKSIMKKGEDFYMSLLV